MDFTHKKAYDTGIILPICIEKYMKKETVIYQGKSGAIELRGDFQKETLWAKQSQIVELFNINQSVVSRHINNIFKDGEVDKKSNMQKMHIAHSDKPIALYSLDVILSVGYRVNSKVAIEFRKWATETLRKHITEGYTINPSRITQNYQNFLQAMEDVKKLLPNTDAITLGDAMDLIQMFANTWFSLDAYDTQSLPEKGQTKKSVKIAADHLYAAVEELKQDLIHKKQATPLFAQEKSKNSLAGIVGNVFQSLGGINVYPTIEEKAAHLLYFIVKNHPFNDGNKRTGAFAFVWFLRKSGINFHGKITPEALTVLTLLVAESDPHDKDRVIGLILLLLKK